MNRVYVAFFSSTYALDPEEISRRYANDNELLSNATSDERLGVLLARPFYFFDSTPDQDSSTTIHLNYRRTRASRVPDDVFPWTSGQTIRLFDERARWRLVAEVRLDAHTARGSIECTLLAGERV